LRISKIHQLALAGLLYGIDHFIPENQEFKILKEKGPFYPKISEYLSLKEKENIDNTAKLLGKITTEEEFFISLKSKMDFSILSNLEKLWSSSPEDIDSFFVKFRIYFAEKRFLTHCQLLSALSACGEYPLLLIGKITGSPENIVSFLSSSSFESEILTGRLMFIHIFTTILPLFEARFYPIPLACMIKANESEFYAFLPGPISSKGDNHIEKINRWLWENRYGEFSLSWEAIEFPLNQINNLSFLLLTMEQIILKKTLTPFKTFLLEEGKNIFYVDFSRDICPICKRKPAENPEKICSICKKEIKLAEKSSKAVFLDPSLITREDTYLPEIFKESNELSLFTNELKGTELLPVFHPSLPLHEEEKKKFCSNCGISKEKNNLYKCIIRKTCGLNCMASLARGKRKLFFAELEISCSTERITEYLYKNNFFIALFSYLKSDTIIKDLCSECNNKQLCNKSIRCLCFYQIKSSFIWVIGAWDKVLKLIKLLFPIAYPAFKIQGKLKLFSSKDNLSSILKDNTNLLNPWKLIEQNNLEIFGRPVENKKIVELLNFSEVIGKAIEKSEINIFIIKDLYECKDMIESYFYDEDIKGLKFLPKISLAIKKQVFSEELREKLKLFMEIDSEKSILPYISFIINYLDLLELTGRE